MPRFVTRVFVFFAALTFLLIKAGAQQCPLPPSPFQREPNIFTSQQEMHLGDAVAQHLEREFSVIKEEEVNRHLREIGERLLHALPPDGLRYQFFLFDQPVANAWSLPGGRIYVSRKLVAFARSEDELAGILAHEIGHTYSHQQAIDFTRRLREALRVTQVADRDDIFRRYHQLLESRRKSAHNESRHERQQFVADQLALYAMARAGYNMRAVVDIWDRMAETKGETGGFWSDFFGTTKPQSKRLREMLRTAAEMPAVCVDQHAAVSQEEFAKWQSAVVAYSEHAAKEQLQGVLLKRTLEPPLQGEISHLRFSGEGKYLLAQDDGGITILLREPLGPLFHIEAENAYPAQFTADSQSIVFYTTGLRVESWSISQRKRNWVRELVIPVGCYQTALSPDGKYLACVRTDSTLAILEVASGSAIFEKKSFYTPDFYALFEMFMAVIRSEGDLTIEWLNMGFSPDGRYLLAGHGNATLVYDFQLRKRVSVPGKIEEGIGQSFAFLANDQIAVLGGYNGEKSAVLSFPSGERLASMTVGRQKLSSATNTRFLMLRPIKDNPVGIFDWAQNKLIMGNRRPALDVYDDIAASEALDGQVALSRISATATKIVATVQLPVPPLAALRVTELSDDLNLLALSMRSRGAVFDLQNGKRLFALRGFRGAYFTADGVIYADFPKFQETPRTVARMKITDTSVAAGPPLAEDLHATQMGQYLLVRKPKKKQEAWHNLMLEVQDVLSGAILWSRPLSGDAPKMFPNTAAGTLVLLWLGGGSALKEAARQSPELQRRRQSTRKKEGAYLEVLELSSGKLLGQLLLDTRDAFQMHSVVAAGDFVALTDNQNRVLVYRLKSGEETGKLFGGPAQLSASGLLGVAGDGGEVTIYDAATMQKRGEYVFPAPPSYLQFNKDGQRMLALLKNQTVYVLDLKSASGAPPAAGEPSH